VVQSPSGFTCKSARAAAAPAALVAPDGPGARGLHSFTFQLNIRGFLIG